MKKGLIVYSKIDAKKNEWFINQLTSFFGERSINLELIFEEDIKGDFSSYSFALFRGRDFKKSMYLESQGLMVFNSSKVNEIANNKYKTYQFLKEHDIPCLLSSLDPNEIKGDLVVKKSFNGHGGNEVFLLKKDECKNPCPNFLFQEYKKEANQDLRVYIIGNQIFASVLRSSKTDFRSNFSLGGDVKYAGIDGDFCEIVRKITSIIDIDFAGIDLFKIGSKWVVNEIEDPVGSRMLYKTNPDIDFISLLGNYILKKS